MLDDDQDLCDLERLMDEQNRFLRTDQPRTLTVAAFCNIAQARISGCRIELKIFNDSDGQGCGRVCQGLGSAAHYGRWGFDPFTG